MQSQGFFRTVSMVCVALVLAACPKADPKKQPQPVREQPVLPQANKGPTDADQRKADAMAQAVAVDASLATLPHVERVSDTPPRKLDLWGTKVAPVKLRVDDVDKDGKVAHTTEFYFKDGRLVYVRHEQGLFLFDGDSLILWLDRSTQQVKRGVPPADALRIADDLRKTAYKEVAAF